MVVPDAGQNVECERENQTGACASDPTHHQDLADWDASVKKAFAEGHDAHPRWQCGHGAYLVVKGSQTR